MQRSSTGLIAFFCGLLLWGSVISVQAQGLSLPGLSSGAAKTESSKSDAATSPSLDDLIKILENDETRKKLVESLKAAAYKAPATSAGSGDGQGGSADEPVRTLPGEIAQTMRNVIGNLSDSWDSVRTSVAASVTMLSGAGSIDVPKILSAILPVGLVAIIVFLVLAGGRLIKTPIWRKLDRSAEHSGPVRKLMLLVVSTVVDALSIGLAWAAGTVAATIFFGGQPGLNQALFLNAFLLIEMIKVGLAAFVSPAFPHLRLTPFSNRQASYWYFWFSRLISIIGYTFLFVAPIVQRSSSTSAADAVRFAVVFFSLCLAISLILKNRGIVRERLKRARQRGDTSFGARINALIGQIWWVLAIVFVVSLFTVWLRSPQTGMAFMTTATLKSIGTIAVGGLLISILTRIIHFGIPVPQGAKDRLPLLEKRLNSFIPNALTVIRIFVALVVFAVIMEAWSLVSFSNWLASASGQRLVTGFLGAGTILAIGVAIYIGVSSWIEYRMNPNYGSVPTARERTLLSLFRNAFTITMVVLISMLVLSQIGIDIAPLLAGAGVVGLAIGFGAQKFVQDIITGAFIQIQNAMNEGDIVELNGISGTVEQLTVRSVGLRTIEGTWYLIPFSSVDQVANFSKDFAYYVADIGVAYRENIDNVKQMMFDAFDKLKESSVGENLLSEFVMFGVQELGDSAVVVRGRVMTKPGTQWGVGRAYREIVKTLSDERGIEIPFPHMTVWFGEDREGQAPPVRVSPSPASTIEGKLVEPESPPAERSTDERQRQDDYGSADAQGHPIPPGGSDIDSAGPGRG